MDGANHSVHFSCLNTLYDRSGGGSCAEHTGPAPPWAGPPFAKYKHKEIMIMTNENTPLEKEIAYLVKATGNLVTVLTLWFIITQVYAGLDFIMQSLFGV
jgi:hypothetical protein